MAAARCAALFAVVFNPVSHADRLCDEESKVNEKMVGCADKPL
jgi:hypothetical protein